MFLPKPGKLIIFFSLISSFAFSQEVDRDSLYHVWMDRKTDDLDRLNAYYEYFHSEEGGRISHFRDFVSEADEAIGLAEKYHKPEYLGLLYLVEGHNMEGEDINKSDSVCKYFDLGLKRLLEQKEDNFVLYHLPLVLRWNCSQYDNERVQEILQLLESRMEERNRALFYLVSGYVQEIVHADEETNTVCEFYKKSIEAASGQKQYTLLFLGIDKAKDAKCDCVAPGKLDTMIEGFIRNNEGDRNDDENFKDYISFYSELSEFHAEANQYPEALWAGKKALQCAEKYHDFGNHYISNLARMGKIHSDIGNYEESEKYLLKALQRAKATEDLNFIGGSFIDLTNLYIHNKEEEKAGLYLDSAIHVMKGEKECVPCFMIARRTRADLNNLSGNYQEALDELTEIKEFYEERLNHINSFRFYVVLSETYLGLKQYDRAISTADFANDLSVKNLSGRADLYDVLYKASEAKGNYAGALKNYKQYVNLQDSLAVLRNSEETTRLELESQFAQVRLADSLQVAQQKRETELTFQNQLNKQKSTLILLIVMGSGLILFIIAMYYRLQFIKRTEDELKQKNEIIEAEKLKAQASERAKHQFLANMSHEIRTPMNAIKGMTDILLRRNPRKDQTEYLESIKKSSDSLLIIINDILDISKIEAGKIEFEHQPFSVNEVINNVYTLMHFKAEEKGLQLKMDIPEENIIVKGDVTRLRQIIINLIGNAVKFTEKGRVDLILKPEKEEEKIKLHFTVSDTGIGIDADRMDKIFKSFEQAYSDTSRKFGGTGLGLSISKQLIELQDGKIWVESEKGKGTEFHFVIPYEIAKETDKAEALAVSKDNISEQLKGIKVLLVEDNTFNAVVAQEELEDAIDGVKVDLAENGAVAVEKLKTSDYDIILMDVQMPVMNGYESTRAIRNMGNRKARTSIIAMTANVLKDEVDLCYKAGMDDYIGKPFNTEELIQKIYKLVKN